MKWMVWAGLLAALAAAAAVEVPGTPAYILWSGPHPAAYELGKVVGWTQMSHCFKAPVWERPVPYSYIVFPVCYKEGHDWRWNATWYISPVDKRAFWTTVPVIVRIKDSIAYVAKPAAYWSAAYGEIDDVPVHFVFERPGWIVRIKLLDNGTVVSDVSWGAVAEMTFFTETPYIHYVFVLNSSVIRTGALSHKDVYCVQKEEVQLYKDVDEWVRDKYGAYAVCWTHRFSPWNKTRPHGDYVLYVDQNGEMLPAVKRLIAVEAYHMESRLEDYFNRSLSLGFDVYPDWAVEEIYALYLAMLDAERLGVADKWWEPHVFNATGGPLRVLMGPRFSDVFVSINRGEPAVFALYEPGARRLRVFSIAPVVHEQYKCHEEFRINKTAVRREYNETCLKMVDKRAEEVAARYDPEKAPLRWVSRYSDGSMSSYLAVFENGTVVAFDRHISLVALYVGRQVFEKVYEVPPARLDMPVSQYAGTVEVPVYVNVTRTATVTATETVTATVTAAVTATKEVPVTATVTAVHTTVLTHTATVAVKEPDWTATALVALASAAAAAAAAYLLRRR